MVEAHNLDFSFVKPTMTMDSVVQTRHAKSNHRDEALIAKIIRVIPLLADLSRADVLIGVPREGSQIEIIAQAKPHSVAPVHRDLLVGTRLAYDDASALLRAIAEHQYTRSQREYTRKSVGNGSAEGAPAPVVQEAHPIANQAGKVIGGMLIETNLLESERHKRRSEVFQRALKALQQMALRGEPDGIERVSAFGEHDGVIIVDADGVIR